MYIRLYMKTLKDIIAEFLDTLPIKDHIKEWAVTHNSRLLPAKVGVNELSKWDLKLHTHYLDEDEDKVYVVIGIKVKD